MNFYQIGDAEFWMGMKVNAVNGPGLNHVNESRVADVGRRRALGAYYTPQNAADFLARWIVRQPGEKYLEPSFGDGAFIRAVRRVVEELQFPPESWIGVELDDSVANAAVDVNLLSRDEVLVGDFLGSEITSVDAAIANPPYVRVRHLGPSQREIAKHVFRQIVSHELSESASVWTSFVAKIADVLNPGGRMAVVLPLDFTYVKYARTLWGFLGANFGRIEVVRVRERLFPDINQDVLLLLCDSKGKSAETLNLWLYETSEDLACGMSGQPSVLEISHVVEGRRVFQEALIDSEVLALLKNQSNSMIRPASDLGEFRIGYVAGHKDFFHPKNEVVQAFGIPSQSLVPSLINSRVLKGAGLYTSALPEKSRSLLWKPSYPLGLSDSTYADFGRTIDVDSAYKCRIRPRWFEVPGVRIPDAVISVFSSLPLLMLNDHSFAASNSLLCVYLHEGISPEEFACSWYNSLTLLSVLVEVHSLGGGVLVLVPNEAASVTLTNMQASAEVLAEINDALESGDYPRAYRAGDILLVDALGEENVLQIQKNIEKLLFWMVK